MKLTDAEVVEALRADKKVTSRMWMEKFADFEIFFTKGGMGEVEVVVISKRFGGKVKYPVSVEMLSWDDLEIMEGEKKNEDS